MTNPSNIDQLIALCDHPWIQKRWTRALGDSYVIAGDEMYVYIGIDDSDMLWLPIGFGTEKLQIVELIEEIEKTYVKDKLYDLRKTLLKIKELIS